MTSAEGLALLKNIHEKVVRMDLILTGNGDPQKGMIVRLDRVEEKIKRATWAAKAVAGAVIVAVAGLIADLIVKVL